jgi:hypothetical protein
MERRVNGAPGVLARPKMTTAGSAGRGRRRSTNLLNRFRCDSFRHKRLNHIANFNIAIIRD